MLPLDTSARLLVGLLLLWAAAAKLARRDGAEWLAPYGVPAGLRPPFALGLAAVEALVGVGLLLGVGVAAPAALGLGVAFAAALLRLRLAGVRRLDCGCFGARERSTSFLVLRALAFTGLAAVAVFGRTLPAPGRDTVVAIVLAALALAVIVLGALVLALYRQVGVLTLRLGPSVALELAEEGPPVGSAAPSLDGLAGRGSELVAFFTADCRLCRELAPAVRALAREGVAVRVVYEAEEPDAFERWAVPGTPFAVHVVDGDIAAKGTVNTLEQLDGLLAVGTARSHAAA